MVGWAEYQRAKLEQEARGSVQTLTRDTQNLIYTAAATTKTQNEYWRTTSLQTSRLLGQLRHTVENLNGTVVALNGVLVSTSGVLSASQGAVGRLDTLIAQTTPRVGAALEATNRNLLNLEKISGSDQIPATLANVNRASARVADAADSGAKAVDHVEKKLDAWLNPVRTTGQKIKGAAIEVARWVARWFTR